MKITGEEFERIINKDPSWCKNLKEPLEVTTFVYLVNSNITHLSPLITFSGQNSNSWAADFDGCKNLKVATGTFHGLVDFRNSGIEKIENLNVTNVEKTGNSANFNGCPNLKIATGNYKGAVLFLYTGVKKIENLIIKNTNKQGAKAIFRTCPISYVPKKYRREDFLFDNGVTKNSIKLDTIKKIKSETNNIEL